MVPVAEPAAAEPQPTDPVPPNDGDAGNDVADARALGAPAVARKVIGVGAVDVKTFAKYDKQSSGPTGDGRVKPDIVASTNVETASNASDTALTSYGGTSAAVTLAAGTAAALRTFVRIQVASTSCRLTGSLWWPRRRPAATTTWTWRSSTRSAPSGRRAARATASSSWPA
ncbi:MAG TPA: S8 family serine peptidase [Actinomycetes bacterium]|nr:S8 family serine peptidase [Actinomycetes bacterium]